MNLKIYTITNCPYCKELKETLISENIEFIDIDVNLPENEVEWDKLHLITKSDDVPIIKIGKNLLVPNVSFKSIQEAVLLTKKFLEENK